MKTSVSLPLRVRLPVILALLAACSLAACDPPPATTVRQVEPPRSAPSAEVRRVQPPSNDSLGSLGGSGDMKSQRAKQAEFLNRIRQADPQFKTIDRAVLNEQNELGLILDRSVSMDAIPALMKTMLTQMAKEFPGQDLTVMAYAPSTPPMKIGTAHLNASTRDMSYTPERR